MTGLTAQVTLSISASLFERRSLAGCALVANLSARLPHIVIALDGECHIISIVQLRALAGGAEYAGDCDKMIQILCKALVEMVNE